MTDPLEYLTLFDGEDGEKKQRICLSLMNCVMNAPAKIAGPALVRALAILITAAASFKEGEIAADVSAIEEVITKINSVVEECITPRREHN